MSSHLTSPSPSATEAAPPSPAKKPRAKHACTVCNSRRVRCDVMEVQPCTNCAEAGVTCEVLPSRRGRQSRNGAPASVTAESTDPEDQIRGEAHATSTTQSPSHAPSASSGPPPPPPPPQFTSTSNVGVGHGYRTRKQTAARELSPPAASSSPPPPTSSAKASGSRFFGESNFLTIVSGGRGDRGDGSTDHANANHPGGADGSTQPRRYTFHLPAKRPNPAQPEGSGIKESALQYLRDEGVFDLPSAEQCAPALRAYFTWFHPCFPVVDAADIARRFTENRVPKVLMYAMLIVGCTYCHDAVIADMGLSDRFQAKTLFYTRAKLLIDADWERDEITLIQSLFLMSFQRNGPADVRDVRYWLGNVITLSESIGLHRSPRGDGIADNPKQVRERQSAASLGLPSRIRDEDCDIEPLSAADLEAPDVDLEHPILAPTKPEHITYAIKMVEVSRLIGRIIDLHFVPGRTGSKAKDVESLDNALEAWKDSLPQSMRFLSDETNTSVWACLLHLAYNREAQPSDARDSHLRILIHRNSYLHSNDKTESSMIVTASACRISRIAEDMYTSGILGCGQMHMITSLFTSLCIHVISIRRDTGVNRRIAENRAQMCLICLKEIQKYWRINNNVLDIFFQYLDASIADRLHAKQLYAGNGLPAAAAVAAAATTTAGGTSPPPQTSLPPASFSINASVPWQPLPQQQQQQQQQQQPAAVETATMAQSPPQMLPQPQQQQAPMMMGFPGPASNVPDIIFDDQYFTNLMNGHWEADEKISELGLFLQADDMTGGRGWR
ncbi:Transcription factor [Cordyceps fumosorosea ARSEF 2679]|uniref:Transcription factor n=1 Tax=Cordyceps fumosorosea (strain ARSEF 2679) TaxID=1081104 RepID=A0A162JLG4_CORFA|nr:Transcription factor [Cordyceps fumosorosea ARSEF 2679]OAA70692.1 Transcription factor [Cordyceps fumosorosea ARSEF 2679]